MSDAAPLASVLTDQLIARCGERAATFDLEIRFFCEAFEELGQVGYL